MKVYLVWDYDSMDDDEYLAEIYTKQEDALAEVKRRNDRWRAYWAKTCGEARALAEPWNWRHAKMREMETK